MSAVISSVGRGEWFGCNYTGLLLQTGGGGVKVVTGNKQSCLSDKTMTSALHRSAQCGQTNNFSCQKQETGNQTELLQGEPKLRLNQGHGLWNSEHNAHN